VLQQSLPTQFNFKAHLQPYQENEVVFSTEAMKNFVSLVTANDIGKTMPAYLSWFAFSWPSDLLGGYNINYAGVSLYAVNGSILLETLDPPSVIEKEKKHYLLYGQRFKMPLVSSSYPVVLDAFGVTHFFRHVQRQLDSLQKSKIKDEKSKAKGVELKDNNITETITQVENNKDETACFQWKNN